MFFFILKFDDYLPKTKLYFTLYTFIEYCFFASVLYMNIENKKFRILIRLLSLCFFCFQIFYYINTGNNVKPIDTIPIGFEAILILVYSFYFFFEQLKKISSLIYENFFFWSSIGMVLYLAGTFFIYILSNNISSKELHNYWFITYAFDIIKNTFFVISLFTFLGQRKKNTKTNILPSYNLN